MKSFVGAELVKFLSLLNDSKLYWSLAHIIFSAGKRGLNKDTTMAIWSYSGAISRGRIFSHVRPFYEGAMSDLDS